MKRVKEIEIPILQLKDLCCSFKHAFGQAPYGKRTHLSTEEPHDLPTIFQDIDITINHHIDGTRQISIDIIFHRNGVAITQALILVNLIILRRKNIEISQI